MYLQRNPSRRRPADTEGMDAVSAPRAGHQRSVEAELNPGNSTWERVDSNLLQHRQSRERERQAGCARPGTPHSRSKTMRHLRMLVGGSGSTAAYRERIDWEFCSESSARRTCLMPFHCDRSVGAVVAPATGCSKYLRKERWWLRN